MQAPSCGMWGFLFCGLWEGLHGSELEATTATVISCITSCFVSFFHRSAAWGWRAPKRLSLGLSRVGILPGGLKEGRVRESRKSARGRLKWWIADPNLMRQRNEEKKGLCDCEEVRDLCAGALPSEGMKKRDECGCEGVTSEKDELVECGPSVYCATLKWWRICGSESP